MNSIDVLGIGNAIVDVLSFCDDEALRRLELRKGGMALIDEARAEALYQHMGPGTECSGGSAANTIAGLASLGARTAFIGKVHDDQLGAIFRHDLRALGVHFETPPAHAGPATARCLIFVTPDAQRTMNTFLGACTCVTKEDIDESLVSAAAITYIEGYLWDEPSAKTAINHALSLAKQFARRTALTLSDTFCVERHREEFLALIRGTIDILFANEAEFCALAQCASLEEATARLRNACPVMAVTRGEKGAVVLAGAESHAVPTQKVVHVLDTTGAGDLFASGFLFGMARGQELSACAALGNSCAGSIIQQMGARSIAPLAALAG